MEITEEKARHNQPPHIAGRSPALHTCERIAAQTQAVGDRIGAGPRRVSRRVKCSGPNSVCESVSDIHRFAVEVKNSQFGSFSKTTDERDAIHLFRVAVVVEREHKIRSPAAS
jgi:hypothetical protein